MTFTLAPLPYAYDALEPFIDAQTMEIHYSKHHAAYTDNFNKAIEGQLSEHQTIEYILTHLEEIPIDKRMAVKNNGGGYYNHHLFWQMMAPAGQGGGGEPQGALADAITTTFGSFSAFQEQFTAKAMSTFGSGWTWLCKDTQGKLILKRTSFQNNPIKDHLIPLLGIDLREHAYYLKHQNRRAEYINAWWQVVHRPWVEARFSGKTHA